MFPSFRKIIFHDPYLLHAENGFYKPQNNKAIPELFRDNITSNVVVLFSFQTYFQLFVLS